MFTQSALGPVSASSDRAALDSLLRLSAEIGVNNLLVQASGGNTSIKIADTLWVKASGKWLAFAGRDEILVPVSLSKARDCLRHDAPLDCAVLDYAVKDTGLEHSLRPSIETLMHAILPHPVVVHVHSISSIAWAVRDDALPQLAERLAGLRWQWVPYVPSGSPLARAVEASPTADVFVLGNHGLVVCGNNCVETNSLLDQVESRLAIYPRSAPEPKLRIVEQFQRWTGWRLPESERIHSLANDPISRSVAKHGILYPCQAIFLGRNFPQFPCSKPIAELSIEAFHNSPFLAVEGSGVLLNPKITAAEYAILEGFAEVLLRIGPATPIRYLTPHEISSALGAESFQYRSAPDNRSPLHSTLN